jgi:glycosyltransferase involved in cell wall biosynthesis
VDVERFTPREPGEARAGLERLRAQLAAAGHDAAPGGDDSGHSFARSPGEAAAALATVEPGDRLVVFVGKLIASKGVELLLAAWPLVLAREPRARLVIVGFGEFRAALERLARDLEAGDLAAVAALRAEDGRALPELAAFVESLEGSEAEAHRLAARSMTDRIAWAGRLDHHELADLLPAAEAMAVPSTFPEAFGMVAAEAAACGALPISADHSGMREVSRRLGAVVPDQVAPLLSFPVEPGAVEAIADRVNRWLALPAETRRAASSALSDRVAELWSWEEVANGVIAASRGELDRLPRVPES